MNRLRGVGVSPGIAVGPALVVEREAVPVFRLLLAPDQIEPEVGRLTRALADSRRQLQAIKERLSREADVPHAYIFDAHLLMLAAARGTELRAIAEGADEREAIAAVCVLFQSGFGESEK